MRSKYALLKIVCGTLWKMLRRRAVLCFLIFGIFCWVFKSELQTKDVAFLPKETDSLPVFVSKVIDEKKDFVKHTEALTHPRSTQRLNSSKLRIVYNRVPKCGSRSVISLFKILAARNNFQLVNSEENYPYAIDTLGQNNISKTLSVLEPPVLYIRHVHYIDFARFHGPPVVYINMIRDPVARAVSHFYFRRNGDGIKAKSRSQHQPKKNETYDECVLKGKNECNGDWGRFFITPFFCGHDEKCRKEYKWALARAKKTATRKYMVIGILEEFEDFVKVLEKLFPRFFKGAFKTWKKLDKSTHAKAAVSKTLDKLLPSEKVVTIAKSRMSLEYQFYDFVKLRFYALKKELEV